jgi:hypothetical protein
MKTAAWIISSIMVAWAVYSIAPDMRRYIKIRSM